MISCTLLLGAKGVIRDADSNTISIFSIIEEIGAAGFPLFVQNFAVLAVFRRKPDDEELHDPIIRFTLGNDRILESPVAVNFQKKLRSRNIINVQGLVLSNPGVLTLEVRNDGRRLARYEISVAQTGTATASSARGRRRKSTQ